MVVKWETVKQRVEDLQHKGSKQYEEAVRIIVLLYLSCYLLRSPGGETGLQIHPSTTLLEWGEAEMHLPSKHQSLSSLRVTKQPRVKVDDEISDISDDDPTFGGPCFCPLHGYKIFHGAIHRQLGYSKSSLAFVYLRMVMPTLAKGICESIEDRRKACSALGDTLLTHL